MFDVGTTGNYVELRMNYVRSTHNYGKLGSTALNYGQLGSTTFKLRSEYGLGIQADRRAILNMLNKFGLTTAKSWVS